MNPKTGFLHMVYFYARPNGKPEDAQKTIEGCRKYLAKIPGVIRLEVGTPAGTPRSVVDNTYSVALMVELPDAAAHDIYQEHPLHKDFIAECSSAWDHVQIYDTTIQYE